MEAEHDRDAAAADSFATAVRVGQFWDHHVALLEACGIAINVLSPTGVSVEKCLTTSRGGSEKWFVTQFVVEPRWRWQPLHYGAVRMFVAWQSGFR
jgi:hypothetical protein